MSRILQEPFKQVMVILNKIISGDKKARAEFGIRFLFFIILFLFFLVIDFSGITSRIVQIYRVRGGLIPLVFYLFTWCGLVLSLLILYTNTSRLARFSSYILTGFSLSVFMGFKFLSGSGYGYNEAILTVNQFEFARAAIGEYSGASFLAIAFSLLFVLLIWYFCKKKLPETRKIYLVVVLFFIGCMGYIINKHTDLVIENFPAVFNAPALTYHAALNKLYSGPRSEPYLHAKEEGTARHIVLIVDESIRGDHLSINDSERDTTPFLKKSGLQLVNLGIASSAGNRSSTSNIIIQSGLSLDQVPDLAHSALKMPSIFQYAKNCDRKTYFIDAQGVELTDYMTKQDLLHIDSYTFVANEYSESPNWEYDLIAADLARSILEKEQKAFVYILKSGAHYPYEIMYPETEQVFKTNDDSKTRQFIFGDDEDELQIHYDNAIRWSVDGFFERLLPSQEKRSCLITYVSDHGQSLGYKQLGRIITHSTVDNPSVDQANTPMFVLLSETASENLGREMISSMLENKNRLSHFQVFPSMLYFMGYAKDEINEIYGPTIFDPVAAKRYFVSGDIFGRSTCNRNLFTH